MSTLSLNEADQLVNTNDKFWWETYGKVLVKFMPSRWNTQMRPDGYYNRDWRGRNKWGRIKRVEVNDEGRFVL